MDGGRGTRFNGWRIDSNGELIFTLLFMSTRAIGLTACFVSTGDVGGGFASDRESHAAAARIAQQLARHELVSGGTASLDRAARCGKMLRRKVGLRFF